MLTPAELDLTATSAGAWTMYLRCMAERTAAIWQHSYPLPNPDPASDLHPLEAATQHLITLAPLHGSLVLCDFVDRVAGWQLARTRQHQKLRTAVLDAPRLARRFAFAGDPTTHAAISAARELLATEHQRQQAQSRASGALARQHICGFEALIALLDLSLLPPHGAHLQQAARRLLRVLIHWAAKNATSQAQPNEADWQRMALHIAVETVRQCYRALPR